MTIHTRILRHLAALATCAMLVQNSAAQAADLTRYVSIAGDNANLCTLAAPCRTLQRGIDVTPARGELRILDTGDYGPSATVNKSLMIAGNGNTVFLGAALTIDSAGTVVALRSLMLNGQNTIATGVQITNANVVHIEHCLIHGFTNNGINASAAGVKLFVTDSTVRNNGLVGLWISGAASRLTVDNSRFENNQYGVIVSDGRAAVSRSILAGNILSGIYAQSGSAAVISSAASQNAAFNVNSVGFLVVSGTMTIESSLVTGSQNGVFVGQDGIARLSNSTIAGNNRGVFNNSADVGAVVETRRNNTIRGNTDNIFGPVTPFGGI